MSSSDDQALECFRVQHDWDADSTFWLSRGRTHDVVSLSDSPTSKDGHFSVDVSDGDEAGGRRRLVVTDRRTQERSEPIGAASWTNWHVHDCSVLSVDVAAAQSQPWLVTGAEDGEAHVTAVEATLLAGLPRPQLALLGHVGDVLFTRWMPSGRVVLTGAGDCQLKLFDVFNEAIRLPVLHSDDDDDDDDKADSSSSTARTMAKKPRWGVPAAATYVGHSGGVLAGDCIDRGRNFISCSRDGTVRLWDAPTQHSLAVFGRCDFGRPAVGCAVLDNAGAAFLAAYSTGAVSLFDSRAPSTSSDTDAAVVVAADAAEEITAFACDAPRSAAVVGTASGSLLVYDVRGATRAPLLSLRSDVGAVTALRTAPNTSCWLATSLGMLHRVDLASGRFLQTLCGPDTEPVNDLAIDADAATIYSVARDKALRRYSI